MTPVAASTTAANTTTSVSRAGRAFSSGADRRRVLGLRRAAAFGESGAQPQPLADVGIWGGEAAIVGEGAATVVGWARADDQQPLDVLAGRPDVVPSEWSGVRSKIALLPPERKAAVLLTLRRAQVPASPVS